MIDFEVVSQWRRKRSIAWHVSNPVTREWSNSQVFAHYAARCAVSLTTVSAVTPQAIAQITHRKSRPYQKRFRNVSDAVFRRRARYRQTVCTLAGAYTFAYSSLVKNTWLKIQHGGGILSGRVLKRGMTAGGSGRGDELVAPGKGAAPRLLLNGDPFMPLMKAKYDATTDAYTEEAFRFDPVPISPGPLLDADIGVVLSCYARAGVLPTGPSLLFSNEAAAGLFLRRNATREAWNEFLAEVGRRHPGLLAHDAEVRERVVALATGDRSGTTTVWRPTLPEVCVESAVLDLRADGVTVVGDAALPGGRGPKGHVRRCDFCLASRLSLLRIEVAGLINRVGPPVTIHSARYAQTRMPARLEAYAALGLPPPVTIYADEALDRSRLLPIVADIMARLV